MKTTRYRPPVYPFTAIVGHDLLKLGLILNAVNPRLGGILIRGDKGTAKSTAVRALAGLLPDLDVVMGCHYNCDPSDISSLCPECSARVKAGEALPVEKAPIQIVDLPMNTTEDRLVGSIDIEQALCAGVKRFQPGLLAEANRSIIYIDEVNLLEDHLVDILLDTAVTGINIVQRESIKYIHPSRFILIATMNPEEGDIRPQLMDRFGFMVKVNGLYEPNDRVEIIRRRECFDDNPNEFLEKWQKKQDALQKSIIKAQRFLGKVSITSEQISEIIQICMIHHVSGHRADIIMEKTARTMAAMDGRLNVNPGDIERAAQLALPHRTNNLEMLGQRQNQINQKPEYEKDRREYLDKGSMNQSLDKQTDVVEKDKLHENLPLDPMRPIVRSSQREISQAEITDEKGRNVSVVASEQVFEIGNIHRIPDPDIRFTRDNLKHRIGKKRTVTTTSNKTGRYVRSTSQRLNNDLAFDATLRAAAPYQRTRSRGDLAVKIMPHDIREKIRQKKIANLLLFVVDASGSMGTKLITETKGTILALLIEAYQKRDKVGMVAFKGQEAEVLLPPTNSVEMAKKLLEELPTGGKTPLGLGLLTSYQLIKNQLRQEPEILPLIVIITDGRANVGIYKEGYYEGTRFGEIYNEIYKVCHLYRNEEKIRTIVIDAEEKRIGSFNRAKKLAEALNAKYYLLADIISFNIIKTVKSEMASYRVQKLHRDH